MASAACFDVQYQETHVSIVTYSWFKFINCYTTCYSCIRKQLYHLSYLTTITIATTLASSPWKLNSSETLQSYLDWQSSLIEFLGTEEIFLPFLTSDVTWKQKTSSNPYRGLKDDDNDDIDHVTIQKTALQKNAIFEILLCTIATYCAIISHQTVIKRTTSLNDIWKMIRQHYQFQMSDLCSTDDLVVDTLTTLRIGFYIMSIHHLVKLQTLEVKPVWMVIVSVIMSSFHL